MQSKIKDKLKELRKNEVTEATAPGGKVKKIYDFLDDLLVEAQAISTQAQAKTVIVKQTRFLKKFVRMLVKELSK